MTTQPLTYHPDFSGGPPISHLPQHHLQEARSMTSPQQMNVMFEPLQVQESSMKSIAITAQIEQHPKSKVFDSKSISVNPHTPAADVIEVYESNFFEELERMSEIAQNYKYIAMDTEFPGDIFDAASQYLMIRENVNNLKLIQLGITLHNEAGDFPSPVATWQFNFKFNLKREQWNPSSIELLVNSGINFELLAAQGIEHQTFAEHFMICGLIANRDMHWYGFHTDHDFAYLLKILTGQPLPFEEKNFLDDVQLMFPNFYDIKSIADLTFGLFRGGLQALSEKLSVTRDDQCEHQAGSDSKITAKCFIKLQHKSKKKYDAVKCSHGEIFGLSRSNKSPMPKENTQIVGLKAKTLPPGRIEFNSFQNGQAVTGLMMQQQQQDLYFEDAEDDLFLDEDDLYFYGQPAAQQQTSADYYLPYEPARHNLPQTYLQPNQPYYEEPFYNQQQPAYFNPYDDLMSTQQNTPSPTFSYGQPPQVSQKPNLTLKQTYQYQGGAISGGQQQYGQHNSNQYHGSKRGQQKQAYRNNQYV